MRTKSVIKRSIFAIGVLAASASAADNSVTLRPAEPTHYLYTPMARVNPAYHMVAGLHELSFALPGHLQIQASIIDNIGKTNFGLKYGLARNLAIGGGLASTLINMGDHGIHSGDSRLGLYLTYGIPARGNLDMAITPHIQIGSRVSVGGDFGLMVTPAEIWSFLWEIGASADTHSDDGGLYLYTTGGMRLNFPAVPFMFVDLGVGTNEFKAVSDPYIRAKVFLDIMVCFITM